MLWKSNKNKNVTKTAKKISGIYAQGVITDHQVWNWFSKFNSGNMSLRDGPRPGRSSDLDQDDLKGLEH